tara:strand:- start:6210 stop:7043 length:834 start_codon:yes stop_codon:yes gene_type:complete
MMLRCLLQGSPKGDNVTRWMHSAVEGSTLEWVTDWLAGKTDRTPIMFWGMLRGAETAMNFCLDWDHPFYIADHAYFHGGHKGEKSHYRITKNWPQSRNIDIRRADRFNKLDIEIKDWNLGGDYILVCPPGDGVKKIFGVETWTERVISEIEKRTDRRIEIRTKPNQPSYTVRNGIGIPIWDTDYTKKQPPISEHIDGAQAVVTHTSNVAVEAIIRGKPVFCSLYSAAAPMASGDDYGFYSIEDPIRKDRIAWLNHLAYSQFTVEEIKDGTAWSILND